ncbi:Gamma-glutamyltranspeptidase (EC @ Glutathione hydrolase (EC [Olavius sp. associated proteobacterium Delta 1]|nr:Gamma-glutamyltranspeptidase (EC @ Glutathione hydrolase (EC [Olavius sp. associated proteobacterium Delta 1]
MVSAGHYLAADAARGILDAGGNAADAGVCGGICLAVLLSEYVNFAGMAPIIYRDVMKCPKSVTSFPSMRATPHTWPVCTAI